MAIYNSVNMVEKRPVAGVGLDGAVVHTARFEFNQTTAITTADEVNLGYLPANSRVQGGWIRATKTDTGGTPAVAYNVGTAATPDLFFAASTVGRAGGVDRGFSAVGTDTYFRPKTLVKLKASTNAATATAAGTIVVVIHYTVEQPPRP